MTRLAAKAAAIDEPNDKLQTPLHFAAFYQHSKDILLHYASFLYIQSLNSSGIPFRDLVSVPTIHGGLRQSSCCWMLVPAQHRLTARDGLQQILRIPRVAPRGKKSVT